MVEKLGGVEFLPAKRVVDVKYGCITLQKIGVSSFAEEVDVRFAAKLKHYAVAVGGLPALSCESLVIEPRAEPAQQ
eukprot:3803508-Lingulodinium_polyedra.AAC.1